MRALVAIGTILMVLAGSAVFAAEETTPSNEQTPPGAASPAQAPEKEKYPNTAHTERYDPCA